MNDECYKQYQIQHYVCNAGCKRWYKSNYHDAMSLVRKFGAPDTFVTVTCNPEWPEIQAALLTNQNKTSRVDIITRVWKLKLDAILRDLMENSGLGTPVANVKVIAY
jgi:hypothetical protein